MSYSRSAWLASLSIVLIAAAYFFTRSQADDITHYPAICDGDGICLVALRPQTDRDGDRVSDADETAADTNPADPKSVPEPSKLFALIGQSSLDSFNRGFTYVVALPTSLPNGQPLATGALPQGRANTLAALGISAETLTRFGVSPSGGISLSAILPKVPQPADAPASAPPRKVGDIEIALISTEDDSPDAGVPPAGQAGDPDRGCQEGAVTMGCGSQGQKTFGDRIKEWGEKQYNGAVKSVKDTVDGGVNWVKGLFGSGDKKRTTDDESTVSVPLTQKDYDAVIAKLGANRRPIPSPLPDPSTLNPGDVVDGGDDTIALYDPDQRDMPADKRLIIFVPAPTLRNGAETNTNFGPNGGFLKDIIEPGSGAPRDPNQPPGRPS